MNELITRMLESLRGTSAGTKLVALLSGASLLVIVGVAAVVSNRPDFRPTFFGLNDYDVANVNRALAETSIRFDVTSNGATHTVSVDEGDRSSAFAAVYGSGALDKPLRGVLSNGGVASVFNSAEERRQGVRKKEWGEMELMLETLEFVDSATVRTSNGSTSPLDRNPTPMSASVTLRTRGQLDPGQAHNVAMIVSNGLGVSREHLAITDHRGARLFDGNEMVGEGFDSFEARESEALHDQRLADQANAVLDATLGPGKAYVIVTSEWNYEQSTVHTETPTGKGSVLVEKTTNTSERPVGSGRGSIPGISSNIAATPQNATAPGSAAPAPSMEKLNESTEKYEPTVTTEERVSIVPTIKRLSIALYLDDSIEDTRAHDLEANVQASVGFDPNRDSFHRASFPTPAVEEEPEEAAPVAESGPSPMVETLLRRGVEIATALVFIFLLLRSLKSSNKTIPAAGTTATTESNEEVDVELLARAQIDDLLKSDPDRVGEILSSWARGDETVGSR